VQDISYKVSKATYLWSCKCSLWSSD